MLGAGRAPAHTNFARTFHQAAQTEVEVHNWSRTIHYSSARFAEPRTLEELSDVVARSPHIKAIGTRHSFSRIADTTGVHVSTRQIAPQFELDEDRRLVTFRGGTPYAALATYLDRHGWALHNMGSLPHISVAGAISTGTHGSGTDNGNLSTAVRGIRLVGPDGNLNWIRQGDTDFEGSVVALGLLGVIAELELAIEPRYHVRQDIYRGMSWEALLDNFSLVAAAGYSVSVFTDWRSPLLGQIWVKQRTPNPETEIPGMLLDAVRAADVHLQVLESAEDNTTVQGSAGPWHERLPHFRIDKEPSAGDEIQSEYFIRLQDASEALRAIRTLADQIHPALLITELRTIASDELWLSETYQRTSLAIHFTWRNQPTEVTRLCSLIEEVLIPFAPRPHWGKVHTMPAENVLAQYPMLASFRALRNRVDPDQKFVGNDLVAQQIAQTPSRRI